MSRANYSSLFAVISTSWGHGDNSSTFNLPDLRGVFLRGVDGTRGLDTDKDTRNASAAGANRGNSVGSLQLSANLAHNHGGGSHKHDDAGHSHVVTRVPSVDGCAAAGGGGGSCVSSPSVVTTTGYASISLSGPIISSNGGNESRPVNVNVNYIIKF